MFRAFGRASQLHGGSTPMSHFSDLFRAFWWTSDEDEEGEDFRGIRPVIVITSDNADGTSSHEYIQLTNMCGD